jgi:hypothetical protein
MKLEDEMKKIKTVVIFISLLGLFVAGSFSQPAQRMMREHRAFDRAPNTILHFLKANQEEMGITDS